ncbi:MAG: hypothetical protein HQM08_29835 [Candidatus Riflebacteria bacterium]|nr:hypothetical protein [Candidatus Riflebacteria bacterium]
MITHLGTPDLNIAGFQLWVHGRQFPDSEDYDDVNWLRVTAHVGASGADVWVSGSIMQVNDILEIQRKCDALCKGDLTDISIQPLEPGLELHLHKADGLGHYNLKILITPNHLEQEHSFFFEIDQSYFIQIIRQCNDLINKYPVLYGDIKNFVTTDPG